MAELDEPLYVVRSAGMKWLSTTTYDLFVYPDRLLSVPGLTMKSGMKDAARRSGRNLVRPAAPGSGWRRAKEAAHEDSAARTESVTASSEAEVAARGGEVLPVADIVGARLGKRGGICSLAVELRDGRTLRWQWTNLEINGRLEEVSPILREVLGDRLSD